MTSVFSKIVAGQIPCFKIAENEKFLAFLDIAPLKEGHTLIIPKIEIDYLFDLEDELLSQMIIFSKEVSKKIKSSVPCKRVGVVVMGLEVPHAHIHLIPIDSMSDMDFTKPKMKIESSRMEEIAVMINKA